jgi:hypothetical protein
MLEQQMVAVHHLMVFHVLAAVLVDFLTSYHHQTVVRVVVFLVLVERKHMEQQVKAAMVEAVAVT